MHGFTDWDENVCKRTENVFRKRTIPERSRHRQENFPSCCPWLHFSINQRRYTMSNHLNQSAKDCIAACNDCATECGNCFAHMVGKESKNSCPACCIECLAICRLCVDAITRNSPFAKQTCKPVSYTHLTLPTVCSV